MPDRLDNNLAPLVFLGAFAVLWVWEAADAGQRAPATDPRRRRRNLLLSALNFALGGASAAVLLAVSLRTAELRWGLAGLRGVPPALVVLAGVLAIDLSDYVRHRLSHHVPWLWRLHRVHHTDLRMDLTTALRSHPLEQLLRPLFVAAAIVIFGIAPPALALAALLQLPLLLFQHADVRVPAALDRALVWLVPTPALHRVHHAREQARTDSNYATALTLWDRLFGTLQEPRAPAATGLDGYDDPRHQTLSGMLRSPWRAPSTP